MRVCLRVVGVHFSRDQAIGQWPLNIAPLNEVKVVGEQLSLEDARHSYRFMAIGVEGRSAVAGIMRFTQACLRALK